MKNSTTSPQQKPDLSLDASNYTANTLEELRKFQDAPRFEPTPTVIPEWYAEKLKATRSVNINSVFANIRSLDSLPMPEQMIDYKDAAKAFYRCMEIESSRCGYLPQVDDHNKAIIQNLVRWAIYDKECAYDLRKGFVLSGGVGTGKTFLMRCLQKFTHATKCDLRLFAFNAAIDVFTEISSNVSEIRTFQNKNRCFDDFGMEQDSLKSFGNTIDVMAQIVSKRHELFERTGLITHFTTNLTPDEIEQKYESRIADRIYQMCNFIAITGKSRRL